MFDSDNNVIGFYRENGEYGCFSNWYMASFEIGKITYNCVEQYMMFQKAMMFGEFGIAEQVMESNDPSAINKLGHSQMKFFNSNIWDKVSYTILKRAIKAKFTQNDDLKKILLSTDNKILCECAPKDYIWGIGLGMDEDYKDVSKWNGTNYLGRALMKVRDEIKHGDDTFIDAYDLEPISEWNMLPGVLRQNPKYYKAIQAYVLTLPSKSAKDAFLYGTSFSGWEEAMHTNMGGGLPPNGFYEMKQEIYDLSR